MSVVLISLPAPIRISPSIIAEGVILIILIAVIVPASIITAPVIFVPSIIISDVLYQSVMIVSPESFFFVLPVRFGVRCTRLVPLAGLTDYIHSGPLCVIGNGIACIVISLCMSLPLLFELAISDLPSLWPFTIRQNIHKFDFTKENLLADKMIVHLNVLCPGVKDGVLSYLDVADIVTIYRCRFKCPPPHADPLRAS